MIYRFTSYLAEWNTVTREYHCTSIRCIYTYPYEAKLTCTMLNFHSCFEHWPTDLICTPNSYWHYTMYMYTGQWQWSICPMRFEVLTVQEKSLMEESWDADLQIFYSFQDCMGEMSKHKSCRTAHAQIFRWYYSPPTAKIPKCTTISKDHNEKKKKLPQGTSSHKQKITSPLMKYLCSTGATTSQPRYFKLGLACVISLFDVVRQRRWHQLLAVWKVCVTLRPLFGAW